MNDWTTFMVSLFIVGCTLGVMLGVLVQRWRDRRRGGH